MDITACLAQWRANPSPMVVARVTEAKGSTPREAGVFMLVGEHALAGTVGGGALEYACVERARAMLGSNTSSARMRFVLGGGNTSQCCGGIAHVSLQKLTPKLAVTLEHDMARARAARPVLCLFGAGHVGRALAHVLALLPLNLIWVDPRAQEFGQPPAGVDVRVTSDWSAVMESLPAGSGVLVLTPDHVLDALITEAALCNDNLVYVGLIGSATKRRRFEHAFRATGVAEGRIQALVCPIGERGIKDKRPEVIAALVAAEVVERLLHPSGGGGESGGC
ncbi:MAG: xanthine dehydrogenase accessory protein XdhC [Acetobacter peroxydans]|jgi:xanthine dehydrogenase accessory factor|nr:xanthine dehydrogenase accessory protein XdhC [Acetobacter peroxydans]MCI2008478.1 xanthine dehydrogenase accessory protein XdhC [Acetobacter peroxydans]MCI2078328.1 xanthine dehydrogenase accessory protein XdhC [Acetobacter peroxydans]